MKLQQSGRRRRSSRPKQVSRQRGINLVEASLKSMQKSRKMSKPMEMKKMNCLFESLPKSELVLLLPRFLQWRPQSSCLMAYRMMMNIKRKMMHQSRLQKLLKKKRAPFRSILRTEHVLQTLRLLKLAYLHSGGRRLGDSDVLMTELAASIRNLDFDSSPP